VRAEDAEQELREDVRRARELVPDLFQELTSLVPSQQSQVTEPPTPPPVESVVATQSPGDAKRAVVTPSEPTVPIVRHEADIEISPSVTVSSNVFKASEVGVKVVDASPSQASELDRTALAADRPLTREDVVNVSTNVTQTPPVVKASVVAPVHMVRTSAPCMASTAPRQYVPTPSVTAVTPDEVDSNAAWAAAVARRNRSVDEESSDDDDESMDDEFENTKKTSVTPPLGKIVQLVASQPNRFKPNFASSDLAREPKLDAAPSPVSVAAKLAAFEPSRASDKQPPPLNADDVSKTESEVEYAAGSVAARASLFGEQASFRARGY